MSCSASLLKESAPYGARTNAGFSAMPGSEALSDLSELFKLFGDVTRLRILCLLSQKERCVCDLSDALSISQSAVSHQLSWLKRGKLINHRRAGKSVFYSLADDHVRSIISQGLEHVNE